MLLNCSAITDFIFKILIEINKLLSEKSFVSVIYKVNNKILKLTFI